MNAFILSVISFGISCFSFVLCYLIYKEQKLIHELDKKLSRLKIDYVEFILSNIDEFHKKLDSINSHI